MTITDVRVKAIDHSAKYLYPNRSVEIKTSGQNILTPIRAATSYEYREKAKVPTDIPIDNPISISVENLSHSRFEKFLQTNSYYNRLMRRIEVSYRLAQYSDLRLTLLRPTVSPKRDSKTREIIRVSPMEILRQNSSLRERFIRFVMKMQIDADLNPIAIPFIELPFHTFQDVLTQIDKELEQANRQPIFFVDIGYENFDVAVDLIANKLQSKMIGLYFRPFRMFPLHYEVLSRYVDKDIAFFTVQVSRYDPNYYDISTMHYLPFFGNDVYSVRTPPPFGGERKGTPLADRLIYVRLFDKESLRVRQIRLVSSTINELADEYRNDDIITNILDNYTEANTDDAKYKVLRAFSKVSELKSSSSEFEIFQDFIKESSTKDYIQEKKVLQKTLQEVTQKQTKLT